MKRRKFLQQFGTVSAIGLSGCVDQGRPSSTEAGEVGNGDKIPIYHWLSDVENFDKFKDKRKSENVKIKVGVDNGGEPVGFGPPAIIIEPNTTITWEWTGRGGEHTVTEEHNRDFRSESTAEEGFTFSITYTGETNIWYYCENHREDEMKGGIILDL